MERHGRNALFCQERRYTDRRFTRFYYSQFGVVREPNAVESNIPELTSKPLLRFGTRRRLNDSIGMGVGITGINDRAAVETSLYLLTSRAKFQSSLMTSSRGDAGYDINYLYTDHQFNAALDMRQAFSTHDADTVYQTSFQITGK